jgi:hypothetical protein
LQVAITELGARLSRVEEYAEVVANARNRARREGMVDMKESGFQG